MDFDSFRPKYSGDKAWVRLLWVICNLFCYLLPMKRLLSSQKTYWKLHLYSYQECVFWLLRVVGQLPCDAVPEKTYLIFMRIKWMRSTIMWKRIKTEVLTNTYISLSKRKPWFYITKKHLKNIWNTKQILTHDFMILKNGSRKIVMWTFGKLFTLYYIKNTKEQGPKHEKYNNNGTEIN